LVRRQPSVLRAHQRLRSEIESASLSTPAITPLGLARGSFNPEA
jgi:hypothetical protein